MLRAHAVLTEDPSSVASAPQPSVKSRDLKPSSPGTPATRVANIRHTHIGKPLKHKTNVKKRTNCTNGQLTPKTVENLTNRQRQQNQATLHARPNYRTPMQNTAKGTDAEQRHRAALTSGNPWRSAMNYGDTVVTFFFQTGPRKLS